MTQHMQKLITLLNYPLYANELDRFQRGELVFDIVPPTWKSGWSDPYGNVSIPLAIEIAYHNKDANNFRIYYYAPQDFQRIQFDSRGDQFCVEWYKIYSLYRRSDKMKCYSSSTLFVHKIHGNLNWHPTTKNPFED